ncbi:hypothetical protein CSAL01_04589 [Colletotrichum salicis]|uniref:NADP-dependent oxidoreductase domain-containing protein n=1 Tax=Colletotrichum salicis TaxID=1209931 RepID=A0A135V3Y4_9PEZI|nr:hypothetical protein CSAL01_04589 [Colletotrichum salicis]
MEYVRLGNTGLKVSKIILGCMTFGSSKWEGSPWSNGKSEVVIGKALKKFDIPRQKVVILSKIFNPVPDDDSRPASVNDGPLVNQMGLSRKHVFHAVDQCLERLGTNYIDVLQTHRLDRETPPKEIMRALHDVVQSSKVRYIGASSMYTWEFARLQYIARSNGWTEFVSMQPFYNLLYREEEREMLPFCRASGVGVIPWSPIARGLLAKPLAKDKDESTSLRSQTDKKTQAWFADANLDIVNRVEEIAKKGVSMALVSTAWVLQQGCWPIAGLSSEKRIKETVGALKVKLTEEELEYLENEYWPRSIQGM